MKKLSALIAMILCVTIGGVYAAWTYTNPATDITDKGLDTVIGVALPAADQQGAVGVFNVNTNIKSMSIDQLGDDGDDSTDFHQAVLNYVIDDTLDNKPYIEFTIKLAVNADQETIDNFQAEYSIEIIDVVDQYDGKDIFIDKVTGTRDIGHSTSSEEFKWVYDSERDLYACKVYMEDEIELNDFVLPSKDAHTDFSAALGTPTLKVVLSDGIGA